MAAVIAALRQAGINQREKGPKPLTERGGRGNAIIEIIPRNGRETENRGAI
jgi:hypothetical protein